MSNARGGSNPSERSVPPALFHTLLSPRSPLPSLFHSNRCINCMCHSTENLYSYGVTNLLRVADDFYPREADSHPVHLQQVCGA